MSESPVQDKPVDDNKPKGVMSRRGALKLFGKGLGVLGLVALGAKAAEVVGSESDTNKELYDFLDRGPLVKKPEVALKQTITQISDLIQKVQNNDANA